MFATIFLASLLYMGIGDGVTDNVASFNAAVTETCASAETRTLVLPPGHYRFSAPPAAIPCALNLQGEGKAVSWLIRDYSGQGGYFLKIVGGQDTYGGGSIRDLSIYTSPNGTDGIAIWVLSHQDADPTALSTNPHGLLIDNVQIGRYSVLGGQWGYGVYLDGSQNPGANGTAPGIRVVTLRNVSSALATAFNYVANNGRVIKFFGVDCFGGPGIWLGGGSNGIDVYSLNCPVSNDGTATSVFVTP